MISSDKILTLADPKENFLKNIGVDKVMALSKSVEDSLQEAQQSLRNALAFAARKNVQWFVL